MSVEIKNHLSKLGFKCRDKVTGIEGVITSVTFDLFGCVQALVNPGVDKDKKPSECFWYDINRLKILGNSPVMEVPNFDFGEVAQGKKGPADKPGFYKP